MLKRVIRKGARGAARVSDYVARLFGQGAIFLRMGPGAYLRHRQSLRISRTSHGVTFGNGVTTTLTPDRAAAWHRVQWKPVVIVLDGTPSEDVSEWMRVAHAVLHAHFLVLPEVVPGLHGVSPEVYSVSGSSGAPAMRLEAILDWMHRSRRRWDMVVLDATEPLVDVSALIQLQHAAHEYHHDGEVGFVTPAYSVDGVVAAGYQVDRRSGGVLPAVTPARDYGQASIPRYILTAARHGFYATSAAIDRVDIADRNLAGLDFDGQVGRLVRHGWAGNVRTLCLSTTVVPVSAYPALRLGGEQHRWLMERKVSAEDGVTRIVFVLNATSISGGIRAVFEIANGLDARGFDVEIWSLQEHPSWFDLHVPVRTYVNYDDLLISLRNVDAIKVATWWETAEVVWLASVSHGLPVYLIQEFETWFYPDDPVGQAAVVASYRQEFASLTEASYQQQELKDVGVEATLIPHGFDPEAFHVLDGAVRRENTVLGLGRSFFQKNFAMTERAWRSLGEDRPTLILFGTEPDILVDDRVEYHLRPRDSQVNELYNSATIFVQTSRHEGFSLPLLEAMAAGCPVITTDSHGNRDFCRDGENCIIVGQDDHLGLAAAIRSLLNDPQARDRLRGGGLRTAAQYSWPVVLERVAAFYTRLALDASSAQAFDG